MSGLVLAIDPGRDKCGLAVVDAEGALRWHGVVPTSLLGERMAALLKQFSPTRILLGDGTSSRELRPVVQEAAAPAAVPLEVVNERHTTERARQAYWRHNPPRGLRRLVPLGLQVPPEPYDDFAAFCMALDHLAQLKSRGASPPASPE